MCVYICPQIDIELDRSVISFSVLKCVEPARCRPLGSPNSLWKMMLFLMLSDTRGWGIGHREEI